jgi:hypothetical protein
MLRKIHGTNFFHIKLLGHTNIKCQNEPVLPPAQVFYFNGQALHTYSMQTINTIKWKIFLPWKHFSLT